MDLFRHTLQATALAIIIAGPPCLLAAWYFRSKHFPSIGKFLLASVTLLTAAYWLLFLLADHLLELQFSAIVPDGSWTQSDEVSWTDSQRRVVEAYFGDGGRNVFAFFAPILLLLYSGVLWAAARVLHAATRRRAG